MHRNRKYSNGNYSNTKYSNTRYRNAKYSSKRWQVDKLWMKTDKLWLVPLTARAPRRVWAIWDTSHLGHLVHEGAGFSHSLSLYIYMYILIYTCIPMYICVRWLRAVAARIPASLLSRCAFVTASVIHWNTSCLGCDRIGQNSCRRAIWEEGPKLETTFHNALTASLAWYVG